MLCCAVLRCAALRCAALRCAGSCSQPQPSSLAVIVTTHCPTAQIDAPGATETEALQAAAAAVAREQLARAGPAPVIPDALALYAADMAGLEDGMDL